MGGGWHKFKREASTVASSTRRWRQGRWTTTQDSSNPVSIRMGIFGGWQEEVEAGKARGSNVTHSSSHGGNLFGVAPVWNGAIYIYYYHYKNVWICLLLLLLSSNCHLNIIAMIDAHRRHPPPLVSNTIFASPLPCFSWTPSPSNAVTVKCRRMLLPPSKASANAAIEQNLHCPLPPPPPPPLPLPPPPALLTASPSSIDEERGSSITTTSVPTVAPTRKRLQVQMTWTYLTYLQYVRARILMFVAKFSRSKRWT